MAEKQFSPIISGKRAYPLNASLAMIVGAIILSFVDLTFLSEVIGRVLDIGTSASMGIGFAIGLVGIGIMAHLGVKVAYGDDNKVNIAGHYLLWVSLGFALVLIRIFSASIMQLDLSLGDDSLVKVLGHTFRESDIIIAPLMFFLYIATGVMVKDGVKNLYLNPEFEEWRINRKKAKEARKNKEDKLRDEAEKRMTKARAEQEEIMKKQRAKIEKDREQSALNGTYSNALAQFRAKEKEIKAKYQQIAANIDYIQTIDKQEEDFEARIKPGLMKIADQSIKSAQTTIALTIRKKTDEKITTLRAAIAAHNSSHHE